MRKIGLHEIRKEFLEFFKEKGHLVESSYSLVPQNDKSLLLVGAGMAPLKAYFTGEKTPPNKRMATCQRCIRTGDIENVGITDRHATFFEMLGNFSFGDYFKLEASQWAWEFLTDNLELKAEDLWVTVYQDDDEAFKIWEDIIKVPKSKIIRLGKEDNFWELEVGPSGPCSEIYVDRGQEHGCKSSTCQPGCECDRFVEVWNLVFTQYDKDEEGNYNPLPNPNIDTGMGLERIAAVLEGVKSIFEVEAIRDILNKVEEVASKKYGENEKEDISIRIITDHTRAMVFLVSDGVLPSNEGRGYVLRRLIRRAARHGKLLGIQGEFLTEVARSVIESWKVEYPEIKEREDHIYKIIKAEEDKFQETIDQGISILDSYVGEMKKESEKILDGYRAFRLYDTYGFPLDLTREILEEEGLSVDEEGFNQHMEDQRVRARQARNELDSGWSSKSDLDIYKGLETEFVGYKKLEEKSKVIGIFDLDNKESSLESGQEGIILLDKTPFYAESGGQVGDTGSLSGQGFEADVLDTQYTKDKHIIHLVRVIEGEISLGDSLEAKVDFNRRESIMRNHSATHLLHRALKDVLGEHVNQAGSVVGDNRLRFDFTHFEGVSQEQLKEIEDIVNRQILSTLDVRTDEMTLKEAEEMGVIGLFEDKYGDRVRVLSMGDYSRELCGGTHVKNTGNIGPFKIVSESSIASGVRRIEAISGRGVYDYINDMEEEIEEIVSSLKSNRSDILSKLQNLISENKEKDREIESLKSKMASSLVGDIIEGKENINGVDLIKTYQKGMDMASLRNLSDEIKAKFPEGVVVLAGEKDGKLSFVVTVGDESIKKGLKAGAIIKEVAGATGGSGGGRDNMAQAGGKDLSKVDQALGLVDEIIKREVK